MCWEIDYKLLAEQKKAQETLELNKSAALASSMGSSTKPIHNPKRPPRKRRSKRLHLQNKGEGTSPILASVA